MDTLEHNTYNNATLSPEAVKGLGKLAPWMVFLGIMFVIAMLFMLLFGLSTLLGAEQLRTQGMHLSMMAVGLFLLLGGGMFGVGGFLLITSGAKLTSFVKYPTSTTFDHFVVKQQRFWMVMGFYAILFLITIVVAMALAPRLVALTTKGAMG